MFAEASQIVNNRPSYLSHVLILTFALQIVSMSRVKYPSQIEANSSECLGCILAFVVAFPKPGLGPQLAMITAKGRSCDCNRRSRKCTSVEDT